MIRPDPKPQTFRSKKYLAWVRKQPCVICGKPSIAHHESLGIRGVSIKPPDSQAVPLCAICHKLRHDQGVETFWDGMVISKIIIETISTYIEEELNFDPESVIIDFLTEFLSENGG